MDNQKQKKKKSVMDTLSATMVLVLIALLLVFVGYTYLALKNGYTLDDLIAGGISVIRYTEQQADPGCLRQRDLPADHQDADGRAGDPGFFQR